MKNKYNNNNNSSNKNNTTNKNNVTSPSPPQNSKETMFIVQALCTLFHIEGAQIFQKEATSRPFEAT